MRDPPPAPTFVGFKHLLAGVELTLLSIRCGEEKKMTVTPIDELSCVEEWFLPPGFEARYESRISYRCFEYAVLSIAEKPTPKPRNILRLSYDSRARLRNAFPLVRRHPVLMPSGALHVCCSYPQDGR